MKKIFIDTRELEAPLPMQKVLLALRDLKEGEYILQRHRMFPKILIDRLEGSEMDSEVVERDGEFFIYIFFKKDKDKMREVIKDV